MRGGGANYRDEDRLAHMMRAVERIKEKMCGNLSKESAWEKFESRD